MVSYTVINVILRVFGLLSVLISARQLTLAQYSQLALMLGSIGLVTELSLMGLNSSLLKYAAIYNGNSSKLKSIYSRSLALMVSTGFLISIVFYFLPESATGPYKDNFILLMTGTIFTLCLSPRVTLLLACSKQIKSSLLNFYTTIIRFFWVISLAYTDNSVAVDYVYAYAIPPIFVFLLAEINSNVKFSWSSFKLFETGIDAKFTRNMLVWAIFTAIYWRQDLYILNYLGESNLVGMYDLIFKVLVASMIIPNAIGSYLKPLFIGKDLSEQLSVMKKINPWLYSGSIVLIACTGIVGQFLAYYLPKSYPNLVVPILIASIGNLFYMIAIPMNDILFSNESGEIFAIQALTVSIVCALVTFFTVKHLGVFSISLSYVLASIIPFLLSYFRLKKYIHEQSKDAGLTAA